MNGADALTALWGAVAAHRQGDAFWLSEILLEIIRQETGFDGDKLGAQPLHN